MTDAIHSQIWQELQYRQGHGYTDMVC